MAINNNTNNKIEEDNIIFAVQGAKSFLKCKMDWVGIGKLHVSFVSHTGLENGCKQLGHIEAALPFDGEDGALALGKMILRGDLDKGRARSIKKAKETGAKYPEPVFTYNGGSEAKADRPVMWRQVSIAPGAKSDFVFQVTEAEGEKNVRGGYQKRSARRSSASRWVSAAGNCWNTPRKSKHITRITLQTLNDMRGIGRRMHRFLLRQLLLRFRLGFLLL